MGDREKEVKRYLAEHKVDELLAAALRDAIKHNAPDPFAHIARYLTSEIGPRPSGAVGTFLRILTINDVYSLEHYPRFATAVKSARKSASKLDCVVISTLNGDFLSPCILTSIDGGKAMLEGLNMAEVDFVCLGNHELDLTWQQLRAKIDGFKGICLNSNLHNAELKGLPRYHKLQVGDKTALLGGFLTEDVSIYAPNVNPEFTPVTEACSQVWDEAKAELGFTPDLFVPLTHQLVGDDRKTAKAIAKHAELSKCTPCLLGGHEHDLFIEEEGKSTIIKVGQDAERFGVVDIWWDQDGNIKSAYKVLPCAEYSLDAAGQELVESKNVFLNEMMSTPIATVPEPMSSKRVRFESSGLATFLLSIVKRGLVNDGVEVVMLQGGGVRGSTDYEPGPFTMGNLYKEFGFETQIAIIPLTGKIIADSIVSSRSAPKPAPNFLHLDDGCRVTDEAGGHVLEMINHEPIDLDRIYTVATYQFLLSGLNIIQPLLGYVQENVKVPDLEICRPIKHIAMEVCMKDAWRKLLGLPQHGGVDCKIRRRKSTSGDMHEELLGTIDSAMDKMDINGDGFIQPSELLAYLEKNDMSGTLVEQMIKICDQDGDGQLSRADLRSVAH